MGDLVSLPANCGELGQDPLEISTKILLFTHGLDTFWLVAIEMQTKSFVANKISSICKGDSEN